MDNRNVGTVSELAEAVKCLNFGDNRPRPIFRGVSRISYSLKSKVGRLPNYSLSREESLLRQFKERCILHGSSLPLVPADDWDWLPLAQHHGLATRLLDWTKSPLAAAFFAVESTHNEEDAAIYAFNPEEIISKEFCRKKNISPFNLPPNYPWIVLVPAHFSPRIAAQEGVFILSRDPRANLKAIKMVRFIIKREARATLRTELYRMGIHRASLFPDIDNLCRHLNTYWSMTK